MSFLRLSGDDTRAGILCAKEVHISTTPFSTYMIWLFVIYIGLFTIRAFMLTCLYPLLSRMGYGVQPKECVMMTWGALRGAVSLALALLVENDNNLLCTVQKSVLELTAGIVALTLLINAPTTAMLYTKLDMYKHNVYKCACLWR